MKWMLAQFRFVNCYNNRRVDVYFMACIEVETK